MAKALTGWLAAALLVVAVVTGALWWQQRRVERAEMDAGLAASRTLAAVFRRISALQVARLTGVAVTRVDGSSGFGMFANVQTTRAPYTVAYQLDLSRMPPSAYHWDAKHRRMTVDLPDVTVGKPAIDLAQATTMQGGLFISRRSGVMMERQVAVNLALAAAAAAGSADKLTGARAAARAAIMPLVTAPLAAAGVTGVTVIVRLPGDPLPAGPDSERWDASRAIGQVLRQNR